MCNSLTRVQKSKTKLNIVSLYLRHRIILIKRLNLRSTYKCLDAGKVACDWKKAVTLLLFKKGNKQDFNNYRPITLLSQTYKLLSRILARRLTNKMEVYLTHEQAGFKRKYSTIDHSLTVEVLIEKVNEYYLLLYVALVDYEKAFDSIETRETLWKSRVDCRYKRNCRYERYKRKLFESPKIRR